MCCNNTTLHDNGAISCRLDETINHLLKKYQLKKAGFSFHQWAGAENQVWVLQCPSFVYSLLQLISQYAKHIFDGKILQNKYQQNNHI